MTWLSVCVDFGADSKGQQFLKTFYAGCVKVCVWGVIIDFVALALNHPPPPTFRNRLANRNCVPVSILFSSCFDLCPIMYKARVWAESPRGPFYPRSTKLGLDTTEPFNLVLIPHLWSASWLLGSASSIAALFNDAS